MKINKATSLNVKTNTNKNVAFKSLGDFHPNKLFEPQRAGNMSRALFLINAYVFLLGARFFKSRKVIESNQPSVNNEPKKRSISNEQRETLIRDIPTILIAVNGVPFFEKKFAKVLHDKYGFAILKDKNSPKDGVASGSQIEDWYKFDENLHGGIDKFNQRLDELGADLKKVTSSLSEEIKGKLSTFSNKNDEFIKKLSENQDLKKEITEAFKGENNAFKQASFLQTIPKVTGIAITLALIGIGIPKLNIFITEQVNKGKKPTNAVKPEEQPKQQPSMKTAQNSSTNEKSQAFAAFLKDK